MFFLSHSPLLTSPLLTESAFCIILSRFLSSKITKETDLTIISCSGFFAVTFPNKLLSKVSILSLRRLTITLKSIWPRFLIHGNSSMRFTLTLFTLNIWIRFGIKSFRLKISLCLLLCFQNGFIKRKKKYINFMINHFFRQQFSRSSIKYVKKV